MHLEGASINSVDASGRIALRDHVIDELNGSVVITLGFDENLLMFAPEQWTEFVMQLEGDDDEMDPDTDDLRRLFLAPATTVELDDRGRVKLPEPLRDWAGLKPGKSRAMVLSIGTRWEIWDQRTYKEYMLSRRGALKDIARRKFSNTPSGSGEAEDEVR